MIEAPSGGQKGVESHVRRKKNRSENNRSFALAKDQFISNWFSVGSVPKNETLPFLFKSLKREGRAVTTGIYVLPIKRRLCGSSAD